MTDGSLEPAAPRRSALVWVVVAVALAAIVLGVGSWAFWVADGSPGTPQDFRDDVARTGLPVEWSNNGPRGGEGTVSSSCGTTAVEINDFDGVLRVRWNGEDERLTAATVEAILECALPE